MRIEVLPDVETVARRGAAIVAEAALEAVAARGRFVVAFSGGRTPWILLRALATMEIPWSSVWIAQVDERVAPDGDPDRNLTHLLESLSAGPALAAERIRAMPVNLAGPDDAAARYAATLREIAGQPPVLDLVHLGLGADGHTASLVPGDPVLDVTDADVAATGIYQGRRRMTLTYPILNRAGSVLWVVTGGDKAGILRRLLDGDATIPAGRVASDRAIVLADEAAAGR